MTSPQPTSRELWLARLREARFPPLASVRAAARELRPSAASARWAELYARDPLLALQVFRQINQRRDTHVVRLEQAPVFMGEEPFQALARDGDTLEERLAGDERDAYMGALRRSLLRGRLAARWGVDHGFQAPEELYFSGLFLGVAELAIRFLEPRLGRRVDDHLGAGACWDGRESEVLGFSQRELALDIARSLDLPQLMSVDNGGEAREVGKAALIRGVAAVTDRAADSAEELEAVLEGLADAWGRSPERLRSDVFDCARQCAREALAWYPRAQDAEWVELHPRPHVWRAPPAAAPAAPAAAGLSPASPPPGEGAGNPLRQDKAAGAPPPASPPPRPRSKTPANPHEAILHVVEQLTTGARLGRCMFFVVDRRKGQVRARYHRGLAADSPLATLAVGLEDRNLFGMMTKKPAALWVDAGQRANVEAALTGPLQQLAPAGDFFVASIFVRQRPLGLLFADNGDGAPLTAEAYERFKKAQRYLGRQLETMAARAPARA